MTNVFEKTYDIAIDFYGYGSFVTAFLATKIQAKKKATWLHDENHTDEKRSKILMRI